MVMAGLKLIAFVILLEIMKWDKSTDNLCTYTRYSICKATSGSMKGAILNVLSWLLLLLHTGMLLTLQSIADV